MSCPRCGIDPTGCQCEVQDSDCFEVTGDGSGDSPYIVSPVIAPAAQSLITCTPQGLLATLPDELLATPSAQLYATVNQSIPGSSAVTTVNFDSIRYVTNVTVDLSSNRLQIVRAGVYLLSSSASWIATDVGDFTTQVRIILNGSTPVGAHNQRRVVTSGSPAGRSQQVSVQEELQVGDFISAEVAQSQAGSHTLITDRHSPLLAIAWKRGLP